MYAIQRNPLAETRHGHVAVGACHFAGATFRMPAVARDRRPVGRTLAVRSAILAAQCRRTIATWMRTLFNFLLSHRTPLAPFSVAEKHTPTQTQNQSRLTPDTALGRF